MINFPNKKYDIIYADPAWSYGGKLPQRAKEQHYPVMELDDICALPVNDIASDNCALFIWVTFPLLQESFEVIKSWGFDYKTCAFAWVKTNKQYSTKQMSFLPYDSFSSFWGMGMWTRSNVELCFLATKGKPQRESKGVHQLLYEPISFHSKKPDKVRDKIVKLCGDRSRIELFARHSFKGWDCWGNEVESTPLTQCSKSQ